MTKDEALRMAIEALETAEIQSEYDGLSNLIFKAIQACKEALAETQEPIGRYFSDQNHFTILGLERDKVKSGDLLYTTPPSREWQSLSYEEIKDIEYEYAYASIGFARAIEAKVREKNG